MEVGKLLKELVYEGKIRAKNLNLSFINNQNKNYEELIQYFQGFSKTIQLRGIVIPF